MFRPCIFLVRTHGPGKEHSLKRTPQLTLAIGSVCAAVVALASTATAAPPPSSGAALSGQALAAQSAASFVSAKPSALLASPDEQFVQRGVYGSSGLQY